MGIRRLPSIAEAMFVQAIQANPNSTASRQAMINKGFMGDKHTIDTDLISITYALQPQQPPHEWLPMSSHPILLNHDFAQGLQSWQQTGTVLPEHNAVWLHENTHAHTRLAQAFKLNSSNRVLNFTLSGQMLSDNQGTQAGDAFEVALLDAQTGQSLFQNTLADSDSALNIQADGKESVAQAIKRIYHRDGSRSYHLDLSAYIHQHHNPEVWLSFDLLGFGEVDSKIRISDIHLSESLPDQPIQVLPEQPDNQGNGTDTNPPSQGNSTDNNLPSQGNGTENNPPSQGNSTDNNPPSQGNGTENNPPSQGNSTDNNPSDQGNSTDNNPPSQGNGMDNTPSNQGNSTENNPPSQGNSADNNPPSQGNSTDNTPSNQSNGDTSHQGAHPTTPPTPTVPTTPPETPKETDQNQDIDPVKPIAPTLPNQQDDSGQTEHQTAPSPTTSEHTNIPPDAIRLANHKETVWIGSKSNVWHHTSHTAVDEDNATSQFHEEVVNQTIATIIALIQQNPLTNNGQWIWEQAIYSAKGQHYALSFTPEWEGEEPLLLKIYQGKHLIHQCVIDTARSIYLTWLGTGNSDFLRIFAERQCYQHIATKENVSISAKVQPLNHLAEETAPTFNHSQQLGWLSLAMALLLLMIWKQQNRPTVCLSGLPIGSVLSDGVRQVIATETQNQIDISDWQIHALSLKLPAQSQPPIQLLLTIGKKQRHTLVLTESGGYEIFSPPTLRLKNKQTSSAHSRATLTLAEAVQTLSQDDTWLRKMERQLSKTWTSFIGNNKTS